MANSRIEIIVNQLALAFTIKDIMIPESDLVRANEINEAQKLLETYLEFDIIPLPLAGKIAGYYRRDTGDVISLTPADLISDGASLINLPDLLVERDFYFVLSSNKIKGFLHFSDLNNSMMKLPLFALYEALERHLWLKIENQIKEEDLSKILDPNRVMKINDNKNRMKKRDVDLGWSGLFSFDEIIRLAVFYNRANISEKDRQILANFRNRVAHTDKFLIAKHKDMRKLTRVKELCLKVTAE